MMKQRRGLNRNNQLRPTPGDPWGIEQHHWNTGAKENQKLNPGGLSNRHKAGQLSFMTRWQYHLRSTFWILCSKLMRINLMFSVNASMRIKVNPH